MHPVVPKTMIIGNEFDYNELPLGYLITVRTFGTCLHGVKRTSVDHHGKNKYGSSRVAASNNLETRMSKKHEGGSVFPEPKIAILGVCKFRGCELMAINVRTNHFDAVVSAHCRPDRIVHAFKSNSTSALRAEDLVTNEQILWASGKSARYLWKQKHVDTAVDHVHFWQGEDITHFERLVSTLDD